MKTAQASELITIKKSTLKTVAVTGTAFVRSKRSKTGIELCLICCLTTFCVYDILKIQRRALL